MADVGVINAAAGVLRPALLALLGRLHAAFHPFVRHSEPPAASAISSAV
jgi:hypothetical protein